MTRIETRKALLVLRQGQGEVERLDRLTRVNGVGFLQRVQYGLCWHLQFGPLFRAPAIRPTS